MTELAAILIICAATLLAVLHLAHLWQLDRILHRLLRLLERWNR